MKRCLFDHFTPALLKSVVVPGFERQECQAAGRLFDGTADPPDLTGT